MPKLIDLDLGHLDVRIDLFGLQSPWESGQFVEDNGKVSARCLLHRLVAYHVELFVDMAAHAGWAVLIPISLVSSFFVSATLVIDVLRQASIALVGGFAILGDAVMADMKDLAPESRWKRGVAIDGLGG